MIQFDSMTDKNKHKMQKFVEELFTDNMEIESWVSAKENIVPSFNQQVGGGNNGGSVFNNDHLSHTALNMEQVEIADLNFFRDLGPLSRQLN